MPRIASFRTPALAITFKLFCLCTAVATPAASDRQPPPSPEALLKRVLKAHENLGPCYVEHTYWTETSPGQQVYSSRNWIRWNNSRHFRLNWNYRPDTTFVIFENGRDRITYVPEAKTYERNRGASDDNPAPAVFGFTYYIQEALDDPRNSPHFARTVIHPIRYHGVDCWKVIWDPKSPSRLPTVTKLIPPTWSPSSPGPPVPGSTTDAYAAPIRLMVIGRTDNLVRKVIRDLTNGETETDLLTYQFRKKPYPPSTFIFVPPPGALEEVESDVGEQDST